MGDTLVHLEHHDNVCVLRFDRVEKLNALSSRLESELLEKLDGPAVRRSRVIIFTGGDQVFSAGADVSEMRGVGVGDVLSNYRTTGRLHEIIADLPQATFSAIAGYCLGGGFELALATDFRIADPSAVFGLPEVDIAIIPSSGGTYRLVQSVGLARAKELIILRRRISAREAGDMGLLTELVPTGAALSRAIELGRTVAELPPLAVEVAKSVATISADSGREAAIGAERLGYAALSQTDDAQEAATAFLEKRRPSFSGS
jgi:enoyl-CoA hydratase/carnithine racemase